MGFSILAQSKYGISSAHTHTHAQLWQSMWKMMKAKNKCQRQMLCYQYILSVHTNSNYQLRIHRLREEKSNLFLPISMFIITFLHQCFHIIYDKELNSFTWTDDIYLRPIHLLVCCVFIHTCTIFVLSSCACESHKNSPEFSHKNKQHNRLIKNWIMHFAKCNPLFLICFSCECHIQLPLTCPWISPHTVTGVLTGWIFDSSNNKSQTKSHNCLRSFSGKYLHSLDISNHLSRSGIVHLNQRNFERNFLSLSALYFNILGDDFFFA